ncbi:hypothetical protein HDU92_000023 [Lobulomyces angularis]|nr:hypothetical protein HDU92_000023 [Lobulomyces angularis]
MKCFNSCFYSRDLKRQNAKHILDGRIPLGICFHAGADEEETTNSFKQIKSIGFDLVRVDFDWRRFQPLKRNEFDQEAINYFNFFINEAKRFKINVIIILSQTPEWASTLYNTGQVEEFTNAFKMYAKKIASLYGDYVEYYQYWNEANNFLTCKIKRSDWWKIFLAGDKGVREANTLLKPKGIVNWDNDSIYQFQWFSLLKTTFSKINEEDPIHTIRIIGIDLYPSTWSLTPSMGGWKFLDKVSMVVNDAKHPCYKFNLAITETGYSQLYKIPFTNKFKSRSEAEMAEWYKNNLTFLQNYMLKFNSSNYSKYLFITIYQLYDQNGHIVDPEAKFGLFKDDLKTPKAAVSVIKSLLL